MQISVIIPTWNRYPWLKRALESVRTQRGPEFEILVVDDGSEDETPVRLPEEFPAVRMIRMANAGPAAARNRGVAASSGEWIAFLDSDDVWLPGKLDAQMEFFRQNPEYRIAQTEEIWIRNGVRVNPMKKHQKTGGQIFEACLPLCLISPSAVIMHRSLWEETGGFDESFPACEDYDLWLRVAAVNPVGLISTPYVVKYGGHADQLSHAYPAMDRFRIRALVKILESGKLSETQAYAARAMLESKTQIYLQGALKRSKEKEAEEIRTLVHGLL